MLRLRDIMSGNVFTMSPDFSIRDAMEFLATRRVSGAPVVEDGAVLGVVSASDLIAFAASLPDARREQPDNEPESLDDDDSGNWESDDEARTYFTGMLADAGEDVDVRFREVNRPDSNGLDDHTVADVMTEMVRSLPSTTEVSVAAEYMRRVRIHRILVMDDGKLCGIVTVSDIAGAVADQRVTRRIYSPEKALFDHRS